MKTILLLLTGSLFLTSCASITFGTQKEPKISSSYQTVISPASSDDSTVLFGKILDGETGEPLLFANIRIFSPDGNIITDRTSDFDGNYKIKNLDAGTYILEATYSGYIKNRTAALTIEQGKKLQLDFLQKSRDISPYFICPSYEVPLIKQDDTTSGHTFSSEQIKRMAW